MPSLDEAPALSLPRPLPTDRDWIDPSEPKDLVSLQLGLLSLLFCASVSPSERGCWHCPWEVCAVLRLYILRTDLASCWPWVDGWCWGSCERQVPLALGLLCFHPGFDSFPRLACGVRRKLMCEPGCFLLLTPWLVL